MNGFEYALQELEYPVYDCMLNEGWVESALNKLADKGRAIIDLFMGEFEAGVMALAPHIFKHIKEEHPTKDFKLQTIIEVLKKVLKALNPIEVIKEIPHLIKKHGLVMGAVAIGFELFEHFCVPAILLALNVPKSIAITAGTLPIGELVFYPTLVKVMSAISPGK